jgi:hypothetical protein
VYLGFVGHEGGEYAAEAERLAAELGPHPVLASGGRVALVEDEVDDLEHATQARQAILANRDLERDAGPGDGLFGPHDALGDRRLGDDIGPGYLGHREPADETKGKRHPGRHRQNWVAGDEDQADPVVVDLLARHRAERGIVPVAGGRTDRLLAPDLSVLGRQPALTAECVDRLAFTHGGEPRAGVVRGPVAGPLAERVDQCILSKLLSQSGVAGEGSQHCDHTGELDPVDGLDCGG